MATTDRLAVSKPTFQALLGWGVTLWRSGAPRDALPFFRVAHVGDPTDLTAAKLLASCYQQTGYKRQAAQLYRECLTRDANQTDVLTNLAEILLAQLRYQEALELLKRCIALDPAYADSYAQRARALVMQVVEQLGSR